MLLSLFGARPPVDDEAFHREAMPHFDSLFRTARRLAGNQRDAEDLVQETFLRAYRFFRQFEPGTNCRAWLMRILHNVHVNAWQKRSRAPASVSLESTEDYFLYARTDGGPSAESVVLSGTTDAEILEALDRLPLEYRSVVVLADVEQLQYKEIASILDVPIGTVRSRLARGRRLLQKMLLDYGRERNLA